MKDNFFFYKSASFQPKIDKIRDDALRSLLKCHENPRLFASLRAVH
jgi:hypothetical protein